MHHWAHHTVFSDHFLCVLLISLPQLHLPQISSPVHVKLSTTTRSLACRKNTYWVVIRTWSWYCSRHVRDMVTLLPCSQCMPLCHRRSLALQHPVPVGHLIMTTSLFAQHYPTYKVIPALRVIVPYRDNNTAHLQLVWSQVETQRLIEHWVYGVLLYWCFLGLQHFLPMR